MKQQLRRTSERENMNGAFKNPSLRGTKQSNLSLTNPFRLLRSAKADVRKDVDSLSSLCEV